MTRERATLVYMPGRGIADSIRLLLEVGGWEWDEYHPESSEDFLVLKAETVHGTIPYLRIQHEKVRADPKKRRTFCLRKNNMSSNNSLERPLMAVSGLRGTHVKAED